MSCPEPPPILLHGMAPRPKRRPSSQQGWCLEGTLHTKTLWQQACGACRAVPRCRPSRHQASLRVACVSRPSSPRVDTDVATRCRTACASALSGSHHPSCLPGVRQPPLLMLALPSQGRVAWSLKLARCGRACGAADPLSRHQERLAATSNILHAAHVSVTVTHHVASTSLCVKGLAMPAKLCPLSLSGTHHAHVASISYV